MGSRRLCLILTAAFAFFWGGSSIPDTFESLFNGKDLSGWVNVIGAGGTWAVSDGAVAASGAPKSVLRTSEQYENYVLEFDYRRLNASGRAGVIVHSDPLPAPGQPWPRGINIQLDPRVNGPAITPLAGAMVEAVEAGSTSAPSRPSDNGWNRCTIESRDGHLTLKIDGEVVSTANYASPRKGYIALKSDGTGLRFRNIRLQELPSTNPAPYEVANRDRGFVSLYNGLELAEHWEMKPGHRGHWTARDWVIDYDGASEETDKSLWTQEAYGDFVLIADMRFTREPEPDMLPVVLPDGTEATDEEGRTKMVEVAYAGDTGIYVRGSSKNQINMGNRYIGSGEVYGYRVDERLPPDVRRAVVPRVKANHPPGEWNRYVITMKGDRISVDLNGHRIIDNASLPGIAPEGEIALQDDHATGNQFQFGNLYIRELE